MKLYRFYGYIWRTDGMDWERHLVEACYHDAQYDNKKERQKEPFIFFNSILMLSFFNL